MKSRWDTSLLNDIEDDSDNPFDFDERASRPPYQRVRRTGWLALFLVMASTIVFVVFLVGLATILKSLN